MALRKTFRVEEHEEYGGLGLRPLGTPHADPIGGMGVVHDILEHFAGDDGGIECELMALGAALWVRGVGGYFNAKIVGNTDPAENVSSDFIELFHHAASGEFGDMEPPPTTRGLGEDEYLIEETLSHVRKLFRSELDEDQFIEHRRILRHLGGYYARGWMRKGFRKARRRFAHTNAFELSCVFAIAEERVDTWLKVADEGQEVCISIDTRTLSVDLRQTNGADEWED